MTIESFVKHYNLHDSYITSVEHSADSHCVLLLIDFAFWMQESYKDGEPENGIIQVEFQDVNQYLCEGGDPTVAFVGILGSEYRDGSFILKLLDDETNEYFEINIKASSVTVTII